MSNMIKSVISAKHNSKSTDREINDAKMIEFKTNWLCLAKEIS